MQVAGDAGALALRRQPGDLAAGLGQRAVGLDHAEEGEHRQRREAMVTPMSTSTPVCQEGTSAGHERRDTAMATTMPTARGPRSDDRQDADVTHITKASCGRRSISTTSSATISREQHARSAAAGRPSGPDGEPGTRRRTRRARRSRPPRRRRRYWPIAAGRLHEVEQEDAREDQAAPAPGPRRWFCPSLRSSNGSPAMASVDRARHVGSTAASGRAAAQTPRRVPPVGPDGEPHQDAVHTASTIQAFGRPRVAAERRSCRPAPASTTAGSSTIVADQPRRRSGPRPRRGGRTAT